MEKRQDFGTLESIESRQMSKDEMKNVYGGVYDGGGVGICTISFGCTLYIRELGGNYDGTCFYQVGGKCYCGVNVNGKNYITDPGTTSMCYVEF